MTDAVEIIGMDRPARCVVSCDHASNRVPSDVCGGDLGLPARDMARHIAYDVGAEGVSRAMAKALDAPAVLSRFSRLVIDPNRGEGDPTLVMQLYDGTVIPANRGVDAAEVQRRITRFHRPYHDALARVLASRDDPVLVSIHSFTPQLRARPPRPWHVAVLFGEDTRLAYPFLARLRAEPDLCVGENEPYKGYLPGDALDRQATAHGHLQVLIEIRNDLIERSEDQQAWGQRLALLLDETLHSANL